MKILDLQRFNALLQNSTVKPRLKRELRFNTSLENMQPINWAETELLAIKDRSGKNGVLIVDLPSGMYMLPFELKRIGKSSFTGREQPIICDVCKTWQSGSRAGSITFLNVKGVGSNATYLCCEDLQCSSHVRTKTSASKMSRAQLRESLNDEQRVERLVSNLQNLLLYLKVSPVA